MALWGEPLWGDFIWGGDPDDTAAADLARVLAGVGGATPMRFRLEWRTKTYGFLGNLTPLWIADSGSISLDNFSVGVLRRLDGVLLRATDLPEGFPESGAWVAPFCDVLVAGQWEALPLGLFKLDQPTETLLPNGELRWSVRGADAMTDLLQDDNEDPYLVQAGTDYGVAVSVLLQELGFKTDIDPLGVAAPNDIVFPPGTSSATIASKLLAGANYYQAFFDAVGTARAQERVDPWAMVPAIEYSTRAAPLMVLPAAGRQQDTARYPNREVVRVNDPKRPAFAAYAENNDPASPISTLQRGSTTQATVDIPTAPDVATAQDIAAWDLAAAVARSRVLTLSTRLDPRRAEHEAALITLDLHEVATPWLALGWTLPLSTQEGARMTHSLGNARNTALSVGTL